MDAWTGWADAFPMGMSGDATSATACAKHLITWCSVFGLPSRITSDRGPQFTGDLWARVMKSMGVEHKMTLAYHPQHNGRVERWHRSLKNALRSRLDGRTDWLTHLPWALFGVRNSPNTDTALSPSQMVFGENFRFPGECATPDTDVSSDIFVRRLQEAMQTQRPHRPVWHLVPEKAHGHVPNELGSCSRIFLRVERKISSLRPKFEGPYDVITRDEKTVTIDKEGQQEK
ncbi:Gag-Pol poly, partial [Paramuricea clavata]